MSSDSLGLKTVYAVLLIAAAAAAVCTAGCITDCTFGNPVYDGSNLIVILENAGAQKNASVQITIYSLDNFRQVEYDTLVSTVVLRNGINEFSLPVMLKDGRYKLYLYVLENGRRHSAQIRDIAVNNGIKSAGADNTRADNIAADNTRADNTAADNTGTV